MLFFTAGLLSVCNMVISMVIHPEGKYGLVSQNVFEGHTFLKKALVNIWQDIDVS